MLYDDTNNDEDEKYSYDEDEDEDEVQYDPNQSPSYMRSDLCRHKLEKYVIPWDST